MGILLIKSLIGSWVLISVSLGAIVRSPTLVLLPSERYSVARGLTRRNEVGIAVGVGIVGLASIKVVGRWVLARSLAWGGSTVIQLSLLNMIETAHGFKLAVRFATACAEFTRLHHQNLF